MKQKIIHLIKNFPEASWKLKELAFHLKLNKKDKKKLRSILREMISDSKLSQSRGGRYRLFKESLTMEGVLRRHSAGYGFVIPDDPSLPDVFIPPRYIGTALSNDHVLINYFESNQKDRYEGRLIKILNRGRDHIVGILEKHQGQYFLRMRNTDDNCLIHIRKKDLKKAKPGQMVKASILDTENESTEELFAKIIQILGQPFEDEVERESILSEYNLDRNFPDEIQSSLKSFPNQVSENDIEGRVDLRDLPFCTIDGETAKDFDDAIYVDYKDKTYKLYVAIADVAHYVSQNSILDEEAYRRGTSVYFPSFVLPMLPEKISNGLCSLRPQEDRLVMCCEISYNDKGDILKASYYNAVINSKKRATYKEVQDYLDDKKKKNSSIPDDVLKSLHYQEKLALKLLKKRKQRGSLDFDLPEAEFHFNSENEIINIKRAERTFSNQLIEEFMIAANVAVASIISSYKIPNLYRVHDKPDPIKINQFKELLEDFNFNQRDLQLQEPKDYAKLIKKLEGHTLESLFQQTLLRSMKQAAYDADNIGHFGLNLDNYSHFTSPIRRYPDLITHRQLKSLIQIKSSKAELFYNFKTKRKSTLKNKFSKKLFYNHDELKIIGKLSSQAERNAMEAERDMNALEKIIFMQDHLQESFNGIISRVTRNGLFVECQPYFVEGFLSLSKLWDDYYIFDEHHFILKGRRKKKRFAIGDPIKVKVKDLSYEKREIILSWEGE